MTILLAPIKRLMVVSYVEHIGFSLGWEELNVSVKFPEKIF